MATKYRISNILETENQAGLHVYVEFLDEQENITGFNEFLMYNAREYERVYKGRVDEDDNPLDPAAYALEPADIASRISANIEEQLPSVNLRQDGRSKNLKPKNTNVLGLRTKPGVLDLINVVRSGGLTGLQR